MLKFYYTHSIRCLALSLSICIVSTITKGSTPSAVLSQARNGTDPTPVSPISWANGNLGSTNSHYIEGMSIPYQCVMRGLTVGNQITLTMGYDIMNSSKH